MSYLDHLAFMLGLYALLAVSLAVATNLGGIMSLCHAAFCAAGAYSAALLAPICLGDGGVAIVVAVIVGAVFGGSTGLLISRMRPQEVVLATLGVQVVATNVLVNSSATGGPMGIPGVKAETWFGIPSASNVVPTGMCLALAAAVVLAGRAIRKSSWGVSLGAMRDDQVLLETLGRDATSLKIQAMGLSGAFAAAGGALYAFKLTYIGPSAFTVTESIMLLAMVILAGQGNVARAAAAAALFVLVPEILRFVGLPPSVAAHLRQLVFGACLAICVALGRARLVQSPE